MRPRHFAYLLLLVPVFIMRDYTPSNELKYLSIIDDALQNGNWFAFYNHGDVYADKPPLYLWLMMLARLLTGGHHIWLYGLFSLLPAIGIMAVMDKWFGRENIAHDPLTSNMILGTSIMFLGAAAVVRMDMLMCFFIVLSLYTFYKLYTGAGKPRDSWLLPLWIFLAVFTKGPVGLFVPVLSILVFLIVKRDIRSFGRYLGWKQWLLMLGLSAVWFGLVYAEGGNEYLSNLLVKQTVGRGVDAFHHKEPFYYYFTNMLWMLAPWLLLYIAAFWTGLRRKLIPGDTRTLFLCVIVTTFAMLTAFSSKLQIYMLPVFPFAAYLASAYLYRSQDNLWVRLGVAIPAAVFVLLFPASFFAPRFLDPEYDSLAIFHVAFFLLALGAGYSLWLVAKKAASQAAAVLGFSIMLTLAVASMGLSQFNNMLGYRQMGEEGLELARKEGIDNFAYFRYYKMENMDVFIGQKLHHLETASDIDSLHRTGVPTIMFIHTVQFTRRPEVYEALKDRRLAGKAGKYNYYILGDSPAAE